MTCHVLQLNGLVKDLAPLVGLEGNSGVILGEAVRNLAIAGSTHLEANPPVAEKMAKVIQKCLSGPFLNLSAYKIICTQTCEQ